MIIAPTQQMVRSVSPPSGIQKSSAISGINTRSTPNVALFCGGRTTDLLFSSSCFGKSF